MPRMDIGQLRKGQWVPPHRLEQLFGVDMGTSVYDAKFMLLKNQIEEESLARKKPLLCKRENIGLKVMTDREALTYKSRQQRRTVKRLDRICNELHRIDRSKLNEEDQYVLDSEKIFQAVIVEAIGTAIRKISGIKVKAA